MPPLLADALAQALAKKDRPPPSAPAAPKPPTLTLKPKATAPSKSDTKPQDPVPPAPNKKEPKAATRRAQQRQVRDRLWPLLSSRFPEAFCLPAVPLAIGIHKRILEVAAGDIDPRELPIFMRYWCTRWSYLRAVYRGEARRNLDGSVAGPPTIEQRNDAARRLWGANAKALIRQTGDKAAAAETAGAP